MGINSKRIKDRASEILESGEYQEARDEEFDRQFKDILMPQGVNTNLEKWALTEDDVQGFMDSFTFQDEMEWCFDKVDGELADIGDQQRDAERDRAWEEA